MKLANATRTALLLVILVSSIASVFSLQSYLTITSGGSIHYPPEARVLFEDDFESGDFSAWASTYTTVGDTATVALVNPYEGIYHGRFQTGSISSGVKYAYSFEALSPAVSEVYARGYFYIVDGLPLDDDVDRFGLVGFEVGGSLQSTFRVYRSGGVDRFNIVGLDGSSIATTSSEAVYPVEGKWYCIEFYIKVHSTSGEYRAWIDGVEQLTITNLDTTRYGTGVSRVRFGLTYTANVQHSVEVYLDSVVISTRYVGQQGAYNFGVIGSVEENPAIRNFHWLFGNQSISYLTLTPSEVTSYADIQLFDGLVVWTKPGSGYNAEAIRQFAQTRIVISDLWDFCNVLYPSLSGSTQVVATETVTYVKDWGNFRSGDLVPMRNETGDTNQLTTVLASGLAGFTNVTTIARYDASRIASFNMKGVSDKSGFYVMDLDATTPETEWAGIWHLFPAVKMVKDFPTGRYARWFANGVEHWTYDGVMTWLGNWVANAPSSMSASLIKIGESVSGRDINATRFGNGSRYIIIDAGMHGNEKHPVPAVLRLLEVIQEDFKASGHWKNRLSEVSLIVIPILNPDGYVRNRRYNDNDVDLNRHFPPKTTTQPEALALLDLWDTYSTIIYINLHEGREWQPLDYFYARKNTTTAVDVEGFSRQNCYWTAEDFEDLLHWGYYDEGQWADNPLPIGEIRTIIRHSGTGGQAMLAASYYYNISSYLIESFVWSTNYDGVNHRARQMLWAMDYYITTVLGMISHLDRLRNDDFLVLTQGNIKSFTWTGKLRLEVDTSQLADPLNSVTWIDVGGRTKPLRVLVDNLEKSEGSGWTYSNGRVTVTGAQVSVEISW